MRIFYAIKSCVNFTQQFDVKLIKFTAVLGKLVPPSLKIYTKGEEISYKSKENIFKKGNVIIILEKSIIINNQYNK